MLILESEDLFAAPFGLSPFTHLALHLSLLLHCFDVDLFNLEFDAAKLDNVVLFQSIRLLDISILDISDYQIDLLARVTRVLQLFTRFSILQIHVFAHELLLLGFGHGFEPLDFNWLNLVVVPNFANVEQGLGFPAMLYCQVFVEIADVAILSHSDQLAGFKSGEFLLLAVARLVIKQALRVPIPSHDFHVQHIPSHVLVVRKPVLVLFWDV